MKRIISDKLVKLVEDNAERIGQKWCSAVRSHAATPAYHSLSEKECLYQAKSIYRQLGHLLDYETPREELNQSLIGFAENRLDEGLSLSDVIYALILMRRHLWLFAEQEGMGEYDALGLHRALEFNNRVILIFDRAMHIAVQRYEKRVKPGIGVKM